MLPTCPHFLISYCLSCLLMALTIGLVRPIRLLIQKNPYENAGLKGFASSQPFKASVANPAIRAEDNMKFPALAELNAECFHWGECEENLMLVDDSL